MHRRRQHALPGEPDHRPFRHAEHCGDLAATQQLHLRIGFHGFFLIWNGSARCAKAGRPKLVLGMRRAACRPPCQAHRRNWWRPGWPRKTDGSTRDHPPHAIDLTIWDGGAANRDIQQWLPRRRGGASLARAKPIPWDRNGAPTGRPNPVRMRTCSSLPPSGAAGASPRGLSARLLRLRRPPWDAARAGQAGVGMGRSYVNTVTAAGRASGTVIGITSGSPDCCGPSRRRRRPTT